MPAWCLFEEFPPQGCQGDLHVLPLSRKVLFGALALAFATAMPAYAQQKSVAITAIVEHPALDSVRDGVKEALAAAGYEDGKNLKWQYQSAQGNTGTAAQIARKFVGDKADVIVRSPPLGAGRD